MEKPFANINMLQTPDLSTKWLPQPKPNKKEKKARSSIKPGRKTIAWNDERSELKDEFEKMGITSCEIRLENCWGNVALGFAHLNKRRKLTVEDLPKVVLSCNYCHDAVELYNHIRMEKILTEIIKNRERG